MARLPDPGPLPRPFGPYQLVRRVAVGGMAEVYEALALGVGGFEKLVALKLIHPGHSEDPQFVDMLVDEAKLSVMLTHANIAQTFDLGLVDGRYFMVMEFVDGADVSQLLRRSRERNAPLPIAAALFIANRVAQALDYAHRKTDSSGEPLHIIHRDVSPQNVLVGRDGDVKLTDFGIAKATLGSNDTEVGVIKGKYCYMSPEQAWADPIDQRSDIYALGIVLHELLTGRMVFPSDESLPELLERVRAANIVPPSSMRPEIPKSVDEVVMRALARDPKNRYDSASDLAFDLERELWLLDRGFGAVSLAKVMFDLFPPGEVLNDSTRGTGHTIATKPRGRVANMPPREFVRVSRTSMLYGESADEYERKRSSRPGQPNTDRPTMREELRFEAAPLEPMTSISDDDEDEETTFFSKDELSSLSDVSEQELDIVVETERPEPEQDATLIDTTGELSKMLDGLGLAAAKGAAFAAPDEQASATKPFVPPAPCWEPLRFVGPALEPHEIPQLTVAVRRETRISGPSVFAAVGVGLVLVVAALALALR